MKKLAIAVFSGLSLAVPLDLALPDTPTTPTVDQFPAIRSPSEPTSPSSSESPRRGSTVELKPLSQCGGIKNCGAQCIDAEWASTTCPAGYACQRQSKNYWDCQDLAVSPRSLNAVEKGQQCGGRGGFCTDAQCVDGLWGRCASGLDCVRMNSWFWECLVNPVSSDDQSDDDVVPNNGQPGDDVDEQMPKNAPVSPNARPASNNNPSPMPITPVGNIQSQTPTVPTVHNQPATSANPSAAPRSQQTTPSTSMKPTRYRPSEKVTSEIAVVDFSSSGHLTGSTNGPPMKRAELDAVFAHFDFPPIDDFVAALEAKNAWDKAQPADRKVYAAYTVLAQAAKFKIMPPAAFGACDENCPAAMKCFGALKVTAIQGDQTGFTTELNRCGGDLRGLDAAKAMALYRSNEHMVLHAVLRPLGVIYNAVHATSLNDNDEDRHAGYARGRVGGYNDKGQYTQWGWFTDAKQYLSFVGV